MFVGVGAPACATCSTGEAGGPYIIFIDEIDAVGRHRGAAWRWPRREQTLNQLLVEMDGFEDNIILIAATNRPTSSTRACCARSLRPPDRVDRPDRKGIADPRCTRRASRSTRERPRRAGGGAHWLHRRRPGERDQRGWQLAARRGEKTIGLGSRRDQRGSSPAQKKRGSSEKERRSPPTTRWPRARRLPPRGWTRKTRSIVSRGQAPAGTISLPAEDAT